jgi:hypothetical protein
LGVGINVDTRPAFGLMHRLMATDTPFTRLLEDTPGLFKQLFQRQSDFFRFRHGSLLCRDAVVSNTQRRQWLG